MIPYPRQFVFNTPGSQVDREVRVSLDDEEDKRVLNVKVPGRTYKFEVGDCVSDAIYACCRVTMITQQMMNTPDN